MFGSDQMKSFEKRRARSAMAWGAVAFGLAVAGLAAPAQAATLSLSATAFVSRCDPCGDQAQENNGVLVSQTNQSRFFADVVFPKDGDEVCKFTLIYHDINQNETATARLMKKVIQIGGNPFKAPVVMASLNTGSGIVDKVRSASTATIKQPVIANSNAFYYVELDRTNFNMNFLGVQIETAGACK